MGKLFIVGGGFIVPLVLGLWRYPVWFVAAWAVIFHLTMRSDGFRVFAGLSRSPDRSAAPVRIFAYGWVITFVPMLVMFALGAAIAWAL